ncbi:MAG TPA: GntG family PLP-dependent aldolase [Acidimicrobiales bacterium]|nr:GntG family PLP-dependent aldolase [Acidimicrobiales bacterium]
MDGGFVDLRSDTVTRPTPEMRRAMAGAEVGDDVYGEDPTVNALQDAFAERVGVEAALFVPSGVMGNQIALRVLTEPGTTVIAGARQHVVLYEQGAGGGHVARFHGVPDEQGTILPVYVAWAVEAARSAEDDETRPGLVCVENTHMAAGGTAWSIDELRAVRRAAANLPLHIDGARLFNAEVATGTPAAEYCAAATTVMCCLSKGLCAPVGSMLGGPAEVMADARVERQRMGGGMRQAGVMAAAGLVALRTMVQRLVEDHERARRLAEAVVDRWPDDGGDPRPVAGEARPLTNIVTWCHPDPPAVIGHLRAEGVLAGAIAPGVLRLVTHHDVDDAGVERAVKALATAP